MKKVKLLIVDDNIEFIQSVKKFYEGSNDTEIIGVAMDGMDAIQKIHNFKPDVVLLDIIMPKLDGFGVLKGIDYSQFDKKPNFLVVSELVGDAFITKAISCGASYFMVKPVNLDLLAERIREFAGIAVAETTIMSISEKSISDTIKKSQRYLDDKIANIFISVGIPVHIKGYQFLREAIKMAIETPNIINNITKQLYPNIAQLFDTSASKVERAIRHAIEVAWNRGKIVNLNSIFGLKIYSTNDKPTNGEFIALLADKMIMEGA